MRKNKIASILIMTVFLLSSVCILNSTETAQAAKPNYNRTGNMGILISAWTMDSHGITPSQCKSMLDNLESQKGVTFAALKITYGFDPANGAQYTANRINAWVDYFDDYYSEIYVASRSVFHIERKLTPTEYQDYYSRVAIVLNQYPAVKCFLGEEEPEAKQVDPYTGDPEGNNLAYTSMQDMMDYVSALHTTWHQYSSIPFSFESIPPARYEWHDGVQYIYGDINTWFDPNGYGKDAYWGWIIDNQDIFAIDEWRNHWGSQEWSYIINWYHGASGDHRKVFIGETFNLNWAETQALMDQFNWQDGNDLSYAFWWMLAGSEYVPSENPDAPEPYIYFDGGYKGHCWAFAHMQTRSPNGVPGSGLASAMTYSDRSNDIAVATRNFDYWTANNDEYSVRFNLDVSNTAGYGGYDTVLGYWGTSSGNGYAILARYISIGHINLVFKYVNQYGGTSEYSFAHVIVPNCWNWASIRVYGTTVSFKWGYEDSSGNIHNVNFPNTCVGYSGSSHLTTAMFGAMGGAKVKLYLGSMAAHNWNTGADYGNYFEDWFYMGLPWHMTGWSLNFNEPSCVQASGLIVPSNGAHWMLQRLRYNVDY